MCESPHEIFLLVLAVHNLPHLQRFHNSFKLHFYINFLAINEHIQILQNINPTFYHIRESRGIFNLPFFSCKESDMKQLTTQHKGSI